MRLHRSRVLANGEIRANGNAHRTEIILIKGNIRITRSTRHRPLLHHLKVRRSRRLRTRHDKIGAANIGIDIVRRGSIATSTGDLESREQPPDDRETGADQTDGWLNMSPESRLVDGVGGVVWFDPEEDDDTVDTGEADEATDSEDAVQGEFILPCALEAPDHGDREEEDHEVHEDVEALVDDEELVLVEAVAVDALVPVAS